MGKLFNRWVAVFTSAALTLSMGAVANASQNSQSLVSIKDGTPQQVTDQSSDNGPVNTANLMQASVVLAIQNQAGLQQLIQQQTDPTSSLFHHYLSVEQFRKQFAPPEYVSNQIVQYLRSFGLQTTVYPDGLIIHVLGTTGQFNSAFNTQILNLTFHGKHYEGSKHRPKVPATFGAIIVGIAGISNFETMQSNVVKIPASAANALGPKQGGGSTPVQGALGPQNLEQLYNMTPLESKKAGKGQTIAIATFASMIPSDAYTFWNTYGIPVKQNRIKQIPVDGGAGAPSIPNSSETSLDVEYSGAVAPRAKIDVYEAPNTDYGGIDVYYQIVSQNKAQAMSTSWGFAELFSDPIYSQMLNQAFEEAAAQGISTFAAAGDSGAYDAYNDNAPGQPPITQLTIDQPADLPYVTAAGGTTLPIPQLVSTQQAWSWDYLIPLLEAQGMSAAAAKALVFPVGTGGGFSQIFPEPWYQQGVQSSGFRSIPDIAMNADPFTGYNMYCSAPLSPGAAQAGWQQGWQQLGGTSFVAPQLAGVTALINSVKHTQIGFWNPQIYRLATQPGAYGQPTSPFTDITAGNNWYYQAGPGYDETTGVGTPNVANLANLLAGNGNH